MKILTLTLVCVATAAFAKPAKPAKPAEDFLNFPVPNGPFLLPAMTGTFEDATVADLIESYSEATGQYCIMDEETRSYAHSYKISSAKSKELSIPPDQLQVTFEHILASHGFVLDLLSTAEPRLIGIQSLNSSRRARVKAGAKFITESQIEEAAKHPAMYFNTVIHLPGVNTRQVTNALRAMFPDPMAASILPAGELPSVVLTASGPHLRELQALLREIRAEKQRADEAAASAQDKLPSDAGGTDEEGD